MANNLIPANIFVMDAEKNLDFISSDSAGYELSRNLDDSAYCMYTGGKNGLPVIFLCNIKEGYTNFSQVCVSFDQV